jgi:UDP-N-acetylmuramate dehydrogenase
MNHLQSNFDLSGYNTFGVSARAERFGRFATVAALRDLLQEAGTPPTLLLGGGSNVLLLDRLPGVVLHNEMPGFTTVEETEDTVLLRVGAGENWHATVLRTLDAGWQGIENLALIPGSVGAAPVQNIGAYGVELQDVFERLEALEWTTGEIHTFSPADCAFGYRDSFFKTAGRNRFCILSVYLRLRKRHFRTNTTYGAIRQTLGLSEAEPAPDPRQIAEAVISIRRSKLPDWHVLGNAGSFFKNPIVTAEQHAALLAKHPDAPAYPLPDGHYKLAAGWLIDRAGWKGRRIGSVGCYDQQALVIVNYGGASGAEILAFSRAVAGEVEAKFGVALEREVNLVGQKV